MNRLSVNRLPVNRFSVNRRPLAALALTLVAGLGAAGLGAAGFGATAWAARPTVDQPIAILQGLDKITARVSEFEVEVGTPAEFGTLSLMVRACRVTLPEESPETAAFLEIADLPPGAAEATTVYTGWMFASSPGLSALHHPIYDVWVVGCASAPRPQLVEGEPEEGAVPERVPLSEAGIIPPRLPPARAGR